jgi:hypothetical protein
VIQERDIGQERGALAWLFSLFENLGTINFLKRSKYQHRHFVEAIAF